MILHILKQNKRNYNKVGCKSPHSDTVKDKRVYRNERCTPFFIMPYSNQLTEMKTYPRIMRKDYSRILARFQKVTFFGST